MTPGVKRIRACGEPGLQFTALFGRLAIDLLREGSITGAVRLLRISWDEGWGIKARAVKRSRARRGPEVVARLGAIAKRHRHLTLVADLEQSRVLYVADDRKQASLDGFWPTLTPAQRNVITASLRQRDMPGLERGKRSIRACLGALYRLVKEEPRGSCGRAQGGPTPEEIAGDELADRRPKTAAGIPLGPGIRRRPVEPQPGCPLLWPPQSMFCALKRRSAIRFVRTVTGRIDQGQRHRPKGGVVEPAATGRHVIELTCPDHG